MFDSKSHHCIILIIIMLYYILIKGKLSSVRFNKFKTFKMIAVYINYIYFDHITILAVSVFLR